jgi:EAL domain-containing protein (putative c-di-GMP-specific phosphodiesterase class I)
VPVLPDGTVLITHFQPIVSARQRTIVGLEALSRGRSGSRPIIPPSELFALTTGRALDDLQAACHTQAIVEFGALVARQPDLLLFLNLAMSSSEGPMDVANRLLEAVCTGGLRPSNVALEILEADIGDKRDFGLLIDELRSHGFLLVLDDVGAGHSNLDRVSFTRPDILKIDRSLVAGADRDFHKQGTLKSLVDLSRKTGALVVAEGVETETEAIVALELGADLLQGYFVGHPQHASGIDVSSAVENIEYVARRFKSYMVGKINTRKLEHRRFNVIVNEILCDLNDGVPGEFDAILARSIDRYPNVDCVYVLDQGGIQVTHTVCHPALARRDDGAVFRPAPRGADHSLRDYYYVLLDVELHKYTTDPYVSLATGKLTRTISTYFRDASNSGMYVLCVDVLCD